MLKEFAVPYTRLEKGTDIMLMLFFTRQPYIGSDFMLKEFAVPVNAENLLFVCYDNYLSKLILGNKN
jgi:hypothetical protein